MTNIIHDIFFKIKVIHDKHNSTCIMFELKLYITNV